MDKMPSSVEERNNNWIDSFVVKIKTRLRQVVFDDKEAIVSRITLTKNIDNKRITVKISREKEKI